MQPLLSPLPPPSAAPALPHPAHTPSRQRNPDDFPTVQLFLLAIVRLAEPIALTSIFPYAWALIKRFQIGDEDDASFYAGLLISSFSLAEAVMGMYWGGLSDRIGRKPVLLLGCVGTMFSMVMVGFASNLWLALVGRCLGGLLNGNIGVIQTMVGELVSKPEHEPKAYSIMPFVWSIGTIIGPAIGGTFADPHDSFPHLFPKGSLFDTFPYLLPNLICAGLLLVSILLGYFLLEETHPDMQPGVSPPVQNAFVSEETPLLETSDAIKRPAVDLRDENYGSIKLKNPDGAGLARTWTAESEKPTSANIFCKRIMSVVLALSIFTYHSMSFDHLLPIFFEDDRVRQGGIIPYLMSEPLNPLNPFYSPGGLGLSLRAVGMIMAVNGVIALFVQAVIFPFAAARIGVYRLFILVTVLHPVVYVMMPYLLYVPESLIYPAIYLCLTVRNIFSILVYPLLLILIKEATPTPSVLGKVNGMAASAGAACRMVAPPIAGYLYTIGKRMDCTALAWYGSAVVAVVGAIQCFQVKRIRGRDESGEAGVQKKGIPKK
ncbi:major facilitator superfamily domain-containing protein [Coniochaeta sp. 2T2.1]|nr:major facilitator superfamily domain-containing protein [Coniochaeta sp. 2T2.1]